MSLVPILILAVPGVLGLVAFFGRGPRLLRGCLLGGAAAHAALVASLWSGSAGRGIHTMPGLGVDALGLLFLSLASLLFLATSLHALGELAPDTTSRGTADARFVACLLWFLASMSLVVLSQHFAVMWAAVEATTLASAPLIFHHHRREALEAAWKYLVLCSVGIAIALLGTFFLGIAASSVPGQTPHLSLPALLSLAGGLSHRWLEAAFVLALVGYGTKLGLVPLHSWLPDAHSQAPSPVSALLSGALLNCALLAVLRFYQVLVAAGDGAFARPLLLVLGFLSIGVAAALMVGQRDYKRLLAYSSVENMGVVVVGCALTGPAVYAGLLHAVNHSLCKAALFLLAGNVLRRYGTTAAGGVTGVVRRLPATGVLLAVAMLAIGGSPPFGPFISEFSIFSAAVAGPSPGLGVLFVGLLGVGFLGMAGVMLPMLQGVPPAREVTPEAPRTLLAPLLLLAAVLALGLVIPAALDQHLRAAAVALQEAR
ncbi:MAG: hypothetical protein HZC42_01875 [Candidatus Eisenbacteria bacterium]|nr:hypothetical protein [Candidatus Eisenbacteria bacterium]